MFICIGYPVQLLVFLLYPLACLLWLIFQYKPKTPHWRKIPEIKPFPRHQATRDDGAYLANTDDHGAFTHVFYWLTQGTNHSGDFGFRGLYGYQGEPGCRRYGGRRAPDYHKVSGDVATFNSHAAMLLHHYKGLSDATKLRVKKSAWHYLARLGFRSEKDGFFFVSARCNNFGLNLCPDGWGNLGQPAFGPQYYTSAAVFAAASVFDWRMKVVYWLHWFFMGGWLWGLFPVLYTKKQKLGYVRDVTMRALSTIRLAGLGLWWEDQAMNYISDTIAEVKNPMHQALLGKLDKVELLPEIINPWCFQTINCDNGDELSANTYTKPALSIINDICKKAGK